VPFFFLSSFCCSVFLLTLLFSAVQGLFD
jgi:hypothetical protein